MTGDQVTGAMLGQVITNISIKMGGLDVDNQVIYLLLTLEPDRSSVVSINQLPRQVS